MCSDCSLVYSNSFKTGNRSMIGIALYEAKHLLEQYLFPTDQLTV